VILVFLFHETHLHFVQGRSDIGEDFVNSTLGGDHAALGGVVLDDGLGVLVEGDQPLLDGLLVVVSAAGGLGSLQQPLGHGLVRHLEVEDVLAGRDGLLELLALCDLAGVAVDEESLGAGESLDHGLGQEVEDGGEGHQLAGLHDGGQVLASLGPGCDLLPEQVAGGEVGEAVLGHDLVALGALATTRSSENPDDGQARGSQGGAIHRHLDS